jgi:hypothetical protein
VVLRIQTRTAILVIVNNPVRFQLGIDVVYGFHVLVYTVFFGHHAIVIVGFQSVCIVVGQWHRELLVVDDGCIEPLTALGAVHGIFFRVVVLAIHQSPVQVGFVDINFMPARRTVTGHLPVNDT